MDRRTFLAQAGGLILGYPFAPGIADITAARPRGPLAEALERMRRLGKYGVVVVVPEIETERSALGGALEALVNGYGWSGDASLLLEAVWVCAERKEAAARYSIGADSTLLLLDSRGRLVDSRSTDLTPEEEASPLARVARDMLDGKDGARRAERASANEAAMAEADRRWAKEVAKALGDESAWAELGRGDLAGLERVAPSLSGVVGGEAAKRQRLDYLARMYWRDLARPGAPYGVEWGTHDVDPCPTCGMMAAPAHARKFVRFLTSGR